MQRIIFAATKEVPIGSLLSVSFERGDHIVVSRNYPVEAFRDGTFGSVVGETLELDCTMYKDGAGKYVEKKGKLVLRLLIKGKNGHESLKPLGTVQLDLDSMVDRLNPHHFALKGSSLTGGRLVVTVTTALSSEVHTTSCYFSIYYFFFIHCL